MPSGCDARGITELNDDDSHVGGEKEQLNSRHVEKKDLSGSDVDLGCSNVVAGEHYHGAARIALIQQVLNEWMEVNELLIGSRVIGVQLGRSEPGRIRIGLDFPRASTLIRNKAGETVEPFARTEIGAPSFAPQRANCLDADGPKEGTIECAYMDIMRMRSLASPLHHCRMISCALEHGRTYLSIKPQWFAAFHI
jgi:hypothetical protein